MRTLQTKSKKQRCKSQTIHWSLKTSQVKMIRGRLSEGFSMGKPVLSET